MAFSLFWKVVKSEDERYPSAVDDACAIERTFEVMLSGPEAEVILFRYAVFHSVVEAVKGIL